MVACPMHFQVTKEWLEENQEVREFTFQARKSSRLRIPPKALAKRFRYGNMAMNDKHERDKQEIAQDH